jgi:hypothetical protein
VGLPILRGESYPVSSAAIPMSQHECHADAALGLPLVVSNSLARQSAEPPGGANILALIPKIAIDQVRKAAEGANHLTLTCCSGRGAESPCQWERLPQARLAPPAQAVLNTFPNFPRSAQCLRESRSVHKLSLHTAVG